MDSAPPRPPTDRNIKPIYPCHGCVRTAQATSVGTGVCAAVIRERGLTQSRPISLLQNKSQTEVQERLHDVCVISLRAAVDHDVVINT